MIYEVLVTAGQMSQTFTGSVVSASTGVETRIQVTTEEWRFLMEHSPLTKQLNIISIGDDVSGEGTIYQPGKDPFPTECLADFSKVCSFLGKWEFVWGIRNNFLKCVYQDSLDYIYGMEFNKNLGRDVVIRHPKEGTVFTLSPCETIYQVVPKEVWEPVTEQARRMKITVGIPSHWLTRRVVQGKDKLFEYVPLAPEVIKTF